MVSEGSFRDWESEMGEETGMGEGEGEGRLGLWSVMFELKYAGEASTKDHSTNQQKSLQKSKDFSIYQPISPTNPSPNLSANP